MTRSNSSAFVNVSGNPLGYQMLNVVGLTYGIISIPRLGIRDFVLDIAEAKEKLGICVERGWLTSDEAQATATEAESVGLAMDKTSFYTAFAKAAAKLEAVDMNGLSFRMSDGCLCGTKHGNVVQVVKDGETVNRFDCRSLESAFTALESNITPDVLTVQQSVRLFADMVAAGIPNEAPTASSSSLAGLAALLGLTDEEDPTAGLPPELARLVGVGQGLDGLTILEIGGSAPDRRPRRDRQR